jgi:hypothetical protein
LLILGYWLKVTSLVFRGYHSDHSIVMNMTVAAVDHEWISVRISANNSIKMPLRIGMEAVLDDITWTQKVIPIEVIIVVLVILETSGPLCPCDLPPLNAMFWRITCFVFSHDEE